MSTVKRPQVQGEVRCEIVAWFQANGNRWADVVTLSADLGRPALRLENVARRMAALGMLQQRTGLRRAHIYRLPQ